MELTIVSRTTEHPFEVHRSDCADLTKARRDANNDWQISIDPASRLTPRRQVEIDINEDFAGDYGKTVEEYLDGGDGYQGQEDVRFLPCCGDVDHVAFEVVGEATVDRDHLGAVYRALGAETDEITGSWVPGSVEAAQQELDRRKHNRKVKRGEAEGRIEPASDWAFNAKADELKAIIG